MKQVEYVSIGGYVFSLEDSASRAAKEYLDQLEAFYSRKESGAEVMEGIEERMAELLLEKSGKGGVVTLAMVSDVISVLGRPETIEEETSDASDISGASRVGEPGRTTSPDTEPAEASDCTSKKLEQNRITASPQTLPRPCQWKTGRSLQWPCHLLQCGSCNIQNPVCRPDLVGRAEFQILAVGAMDTYFHSPGLHRPVDMHAGREDGTSA